MNPFRSARMLFCALAAVVGAATAPSARGQSLFLLDTVELPDSQSKVGLVDGSAFAESVAMSGKYAVVGEPNFRINGLGVAGRVHVFVRDLQGQWSKIATFDGTQVDGQLGQCVAIDTSIPNEINVIAGSPATNSARTWLYMFDIQTWAYADLYPPAPVGTPGHSGDFGFAVAASGNWLFVGQPHYADGFVHVYRRYPGAQFVNYWTSATEVSAQGFDSEFGYSIAASGDAYVVGAPSYVAIDGPLPSAFVFRRSGTSWPREYQITRTLFAGTYSQGFGKSVAIDGDRCVVGAPETTVLGVANAGRATSFTRNAVNWAQERVYQAQSTPQAEMGMGTRVAVDGRNVVVARSAAWTGYDYVQIYNADTGGEVYGNGAENPGATSHFGAGIACGAGFLLVGDPADNAERGALYEYRFTFLDCTGDGFDDLLDIAAGVDVDLDLDGIPDVCESPTCLLEELNASNGAVNDQLGWCVATDGERAISGAPTKLNASGVETGAAVVFRRDGTHLVQEALLGGTNVHSTDAFGTCAAIEGDLAFVGAPGDDTAAANAGALYVFRRNPSTGAWALETKLLAPDAAANAAFGRSVAYEPQLSGALIVGADGANTPVGVNRGKVYVFERNGAAWIHRNTLFDLVGGAGDAFGYSVALTNHVIAIGAPFADPSGAADAGAVHGGVLGSLLATSVTLFKMTQPVPEAGSRLGHSVDVNPFGRIAAGAPRDPTRGYIAGSVLLCSNLGSFPYLQTLYLNDGNAWDMFGTSVAWAGDRLLVGMPFIDTAAGPGSGQVGVYQFLPGVPTESARIGSPDGQLNQAFGNAVAWRDGLLVCGAYGDDVPNGTDSGSAYAFGLGGLDCNLNYTCDLCEIRAGTASDANQNGVADGCDVMAFCYGDGSGAPCPCGNESPARSGGCKNSFGMGALLTATGNASIANDTLVLTATNMPATTTALFFQGTAKDGGGSGVTFGDGVRCVSGAIVRLRTRVASAGSASYPIAGDTSIHVRGNVLAGETRFYQAHYRNSSSTFCTSATSNYTNGIAATWTP